VVILSVFSFKGKIDPLSAGRLGPLLEFINMAKTGVKIARAKNNCEELAFFTKNAGSNFFLDNRHIKAELNLPFNLVFSAGRPSRGATQSKRISWWAGVSELCRELLLLAVIILRKWA